MADWSQLPTELLQLISQKLNSEFYILRFRSVCSTWRSSIPNYPPNHHLPLKLPLPFDTKDTNSICYLVKHTIFLIKPPPQQQQQQTLHPWLIRIGPNFKGKIHPWHPLDLHRRIPFYFPHKVIFDFNQLSVVDLGHVFYILICNSLRKHPHPRVYNEKVVIATCQGEQEQPLIVTFDDHGEPSMLRCGDNGWMKIPNVSNCFYGDICNFKGRLCVADDTGKTVMVGPDLRVDFVAETLFSNNVRLCLVESELLLVDRNYGGVDVWIEVFRLDEKEKKWVKLSNLGDRVLFLGDGCSFFVSASDLGFAHGNCVISMDGNIDCGMSVFHLNQGRVSPLSDYPDYLKLFLRLPEWIDPSCIGKKRARETKKA